MGLRYILLIVAIWVIYLVVRGALRQRDQARAARMAKARPVDMVRCHYCATHLPKPEALQAKGHFYCSREHMLADHGDS